MINALFKLSISYERKRHMKKKVIKKISEFFNDENGMGVVEVVLIVLVLVGLALMFKNQITIISNGIFNSIKGQVGKF